MSQQLEALQVLRSLTPLKLGLRQELQTNMQVPAETVLT
jgi:hypothetical protein